MLVLIKAPSNCHVNDFRLNEILSFHIAPCIQNAALGLMQTQVLEKEVLYLQGLAVH